MAISLKKVGLDMGSGIVNEEELVEKLCQLL